MNVLVACVGNVFLGVDDQHEVVWLEQLVGEVQAANAEVGGARASRELPARERARDLGPEPVVAEEHVAHAGHEHVHGARSTRSTSSVR